MNEILFVQCPYCGEFLEIEPEQGRGTVKYVEDCHVCCQPILMKVTYSKDGTQIMAARENE